MECQTPGCREELKRCINDGLRKKVSTTTLIFALTAIITAGGTVATLSYDAYSEGKKARETTITENRKGVTENKFNLIEVQANLKNMKENLDKSVAVQNKIFDVLDKINKKLPND